MRLPALVHRKAPFLPFVPMALLLLLAAVEIPRLLVSGQVSQNLPRGDPVARDAEEAAKAFPPYHFLIVAVESPEGDPFHPAVTAAVQRLSDAISRIPGVASVLSLATARDIRIDGEDLSYVPLLGPDGVPVDGEGLRRTVEGTPLFRRFLLSTDGRAAAVYLFLDAGADAGKALEQVRRAASAEEEVRTEIFGTDALTAYIEGSVAPDLALLGLAALLVIFLFQWAATRSLHAAAVLWTMDLLPAIWVLALFPLFGLKLQTETIYVPIITVALATSYGIQIYRNYALERGRRMADVLETVTPVVFSAAVTTMIGFLSLLAASVAIYRLLGVLLVAGILLAMLSALFLLPPLLAPLRIRHPVRYARAGLLVRTVAHPAVPVAFAVFGAFLLIGLPQVARDYRLEAVFSRRASITGTVAYFRERFGGMNDLEIVIDTGKEYGFTDPAEFRALARLSGDLAGHPGVSHVIAVCDFVEWADGRMSGGTRPRDLDERAIGEALELLSSGSAGASIDGLIDPSWRTARLIARFDSSGGSSRDTTRRLKELEGKVAADVAAGFPGARTVVTGFPLIADRFLVLTVESQASGIAAYLALAFLFVLAFLRSLRWSLLALLLPASGVLVYLGLLGWIGVPLSGVTVLTIAAVMGVGIDGLLCLITFYRRARALAPAEEALRAALEDAAPAILQSSLVIVLALLCMLLSRYSAFVWTGILVAVAFLSCTAVTLLLIPHVILRNRSTLR